MVPIVASLAPLAASLILMKTRRRFIGDCSLLAATVGLGSGSLMAGSLFTSRPSLAVLGVSDFAGHLGTLFKVIGSRGAAVQLRLEKVGGLVGDRVGDGFSLLFRGSTAEPLVQDTYTFRHRKLGELTLFMVPVRQPEGEECFYEVIFNRHVSPVV